MKIEFLNNQHTPHINFLDEDDIVCYRIDLIKNHPLGFMHFCFSKTDGIVLFDKKLGIHKDWLK